MVASTLSSATDRMWLLIGILAISFIGAVSVLIQKEIKSRRQHRVTEDNGHGDLMKTMGACESSIENIERILESVGADIGVLRASLSEIFRSINVQIAATEAVAKDVNRHETDIKDSESRIDKLRDQMADVEKDIIRISVGKPIGVTP